MACIILPQKVHAITIPPYIESHTDKRCHSNHQEETTMSIYKVEICGVNTSKLPLLTEEEMMKKKVAWIEKHGEVNEGV